MSNNYLQQYVKRNINCSPRQDKQSIIRPARVIGHPGAIGYFYLNNKRYNLPDVSNRYVVYMVGKVHPEILGTILKSMDWFKLDTTCNEMQVVLQVYSSAGITIPLHRVWYRRNRDGNILFAVPILTKIPVNLFEESIYFKFYTPAYFLTDESALIDDEIFVKGKTITDLNSIVSFQNDALVYQNKPVGQALFYVNGFRVPQVWPGNATTGDIVEMMYDGTIREDFIVPISALKHFESDLDSVRKYLVLNPNIQNSIDYLDDLEFYIYTPDLKKAAYYHKNTPSSVRQITHQDYSIKVDAVVAIAQTLGLDNPEEAYLKVTIRKSGYVRDLVTNANRTHELFKLPLEQREAAMIGIDSAVSVWQANNLEKSAYTQAIAYDNAIIPKDLSERALGYNAISVIIGQSPLRPMYQSGIKSIHLPYGLVDRATVYEYDINGSYLRHHVHHGIGEDVVLGNDCELVEVFSGEASTHFDDQYGSSFTINPLHEYRFYKAYNTGNLDQLEWVDVTGTTDYTLTGNAGIWNINTLQHLTIVRSDAKFVHREFDHSTIFGTVEFNINEVEDGLQTRMHVPPGTIDVFLNGNVLTRKIDYHYDFPMATVICKRNLVNPGVATQRIIFRAMGFPLSDLSMEELEDVGFITHGRLSANSKFDLRDNKVQQIVIGGKVYFNYEIPFTEGSEYSPYLDSMNGTPYHVKDVIVPTRGLTERSTHELRNESLAIDKAISNYLTLKLPEQLPDTVYTVPDRYPVVSPFFARITSLTKAGVIPDSAITGHLTDDEVLALVAPYVQYLKHDPTTEANRPDERFVVIIPHFYNFVVDLTAVQYRFLSRVNKLVCNNLLDMSHFYTISS